MKKFIILYFIFVSFTVMSENPKSPSEFFAAEASKKEAAYIFNPYETLTAGTIAFVIGNVGFYTTHSSILKLGYSSIQTIGVVNFGKGLYIVNAPNLEKELAKLLSNKNEKNVVSKEYLSKKIIELYAREDRAKRIAMFYGSSLLSAQYIINAFVGDTPKELRNIYVFLGGINMLISGYAMYSKTNYEKYYFGEQFDVRPIVFQAPDNEFNFIPGLALSYRF